MKCPTSMPAVRCLAGCTSCWMSRRPTERRPAAVMRIREYAGLEPGYKPLTEILKQRVDGADGQAGRDVSGEGRDRNRDGTQFQLCRWHCDVDGEVQADRLAGTLRHAEEAVGRLRRLGADHAFCPRRAPISVCRPRSTRSTCRATASIFRRSRLQRWRTRRLSRYRAR